MKINHPSKDQISNKSIKINIPFNAERIINKLADNGYEAYVVGGCVRDSILKKDPKDWDITTDASPQEVKALFTRTIDTGIKHGTVTIMIDKEAYEVTTYRIDGEYEDHRRPKEVIFTANLTEDLKRRDFTINAMAYNHTKGIIDSFGGIKDLQEKIIRCVGSAKDRFDEDALRILRAIRFSAQLGFTIEAETKQAILEKSKHLKDISAERIQAELSKLIMSDYPEHLIEAHSLGVLEIVMPELDQLFKESPAPSKTTQMSSQLNLTLDNLAIHTIQSLTYVKKDSILRWTMLLHDIGKPITKTTDSQGRITFPDYAHIGANISKKILRRLKLDNHTIETVSHLIKWHNSQISKPITHTTIRQFLKQIGPKYFPSHLQIQKADIQSSGGEKQTPKLKEMEVIIKLYQEILQNKDCLTLKELAINGSQLVSIGIPPGPQMGNILNMLLEEVLKNPKLNTLEQLTNLANTYSTQNI